MKPATGISASLAAFVSSVAVIGCCVPLGFTLALGTGAASAFLTAARPWLLGLSVALVAVGFWQQRRAKQCALRARWVQKLGSLMLFLAVAVVLGMVLFPQEIAGFLADRVLSGSK